MKNLRTSWLFSLKTPGFYLLLAIATAILSFLILQASSWSQLVVGCLCAGYCISLLLKKFAYLQWLTCLVLVVFGLIFLLNKQVRVPQGTRLLIYPDQVKLQDDFASGIGYLGKDKVTFSAKADSACKRRIRAKQSFYLTQLNAETSPLAGPTNPGETEYRKYYAGKKIFYQLKITNYQIADKRITVADKFHSLRAQLQDYCRKLPQYTGFMVSEMLLAENPQQRNQNILNDYRDLGVIHLLSISGLHVSLYTIFLGMLCTWAKRTEGETFLVCMAFLILEMFLANFQPGFVRASMAFFLGKFFTFKRCLVSQADVLGLTCLLHLAIMPALFINIGAILSYLLVLGLDLTADFSKFKQGIALNLLITPLLLKTFYRVNFLTVLYNFLIVPIFNFLLLPLTLVGLMASFCFKPLLNLCEQIFSLIMGLISRLADARLGLITFGQLNWWQCLLLTILTVMAIVYPQTKFGQIKITTSLAVIYAIFFMYLHFPLTGQVSFIDVGQGDSILITTPFNRHCYLIDTGGKVNFGKRKSQPQINRITLPYLYSQGIDHLDAVFLSHQDADHVGDLGPLLAQIPVKKLYFAKGLTDNPSFRKRIQASLNKTQLCPVLAGDVINESGFKVQVVYPFQPGLGKNEDSLSLYFKLAHKSWLFTGDLDRDGEKRIIARYPQQVDYLKLGHHGSKTASDPEFLKAIKPECVFISSGRHNRFGHPHPETMQTLKQQGLPYLNTQDSGTITWTYSNWGWTKFSTYLRK